MESMKKIIIGCVAILFSICTYAQQQVSDSTREQRLMKLARSYRYGINRDVNLRKAGSIYYHLAKKGNTTAMVKLGDMYLKGEGTEQNSQLAYKWFYKAATAGNSNGMCRLARMYQTGDGVKQNFKKAFNYYDQAARKGNPNGCYGAGYLLYKGFGVEQSYSNAEQYLKLGSKKKHAGCDFLLGSLYANDGAGTPDYTKAEHHLHRAMKEGHSWTKDMTKQNKLDSLKQRHASRKRHEAGLRWKGKLKKGLDEGLTAVSPENLNGTWTGTLYTYDWSSSQVVDEENITLNFEGSNDYYTMQWFRNDTLCTIFEPTEHNGNAWRNKLMPENGMQYSWIVSTARFGLSDKGELCARFKRHDTSRREPMRPVVAVLSKQQNDADGNAHIRIKRIAPMPIVGETAEVVIESDQYTSAHLSLFNMQGVMIADCGSHPLTKGTNHLSVNVSAKKGHYILKVEAAGVVISKNIIHL